MKGKTRTPKLEEEFVSLRLEGLSLAEVGDRLGYAKRTMTTWNKTLSIEVEARLEEDKGEKAQIRELERDGRIELLQARQKKISTAADKINFDSMAKTAPGELVRLEISTISALRREALPADPHTMFILKYKQLLVESGLAVVKAVPTRVPPLPNLGTNLVKPSLPNTDEITD